MAVYDVIDLTKTYPRQATPANDRLTLSVAEGEISGLLGFGPVIIPPDGLALNVTGRARHGPAPA